LENCVFEYFDPIIAFGVGRELGAMNPLQKEFLQHLKQIPSLNFDET